jgi:ethanolamine ammonia-lyase small subunit
MPAESDVPQSGGSSNLDPWATLRRATRARIGLGRVGDALPLNDVLDFQLAHARARDAVHAPLDIATVTNALDALLSPTILVASAAVDRPTYLRRPDLGRQLAPASGNALQRLGATWDGGWDAVFVVADGLSSVGAQRHAVPLIASCLTRLGGWSIAPGVVATQARVALGDEIGAALGARICVMLIGERPGLTVSDSLGVYLTYDPKRGRRDSERNCISNIHEDGLSYDEAADLLVWLMGESRRRKLTGVELKDQRNAPRALGGPSGEGDAQK